MTIDVATGIARILKQEGVDWVSFSRLPGEQRPGPGRGADADDARRPIRRRGCRRVLADHRGNAHRVCTFQGGVNAAGMQYAYAGLAQAYEDGSPSSASPMGSPLGVRAIASLTSRPA